MEHIEEIYQKSIQVQEDCVKELLLHGTSLKNIEKFSSFQDNSIFILDKTSGVGYNIKETWENSTFIIIATPEIFADWLAKI